MVVHFPQKDDRVPDSIVNFGFLSYCSKFVLSLLILSQVRPDSGSFDQRIINAKMRREGQSSFKYSKNIASFEFFFYRFNLVLS